MSSTSDNFKSKISDFTEKIQKIKKNYNLNNTKIPLSNDQKAKLKYNLQNIKKDLNNFKQEYLNSNYRSVLSSDQDEFRKEQINDIISEIDIMINNYCKVAYQINLKEEDFKDEEFNNPMEKMQYQKRKLLEQDKIIDEILVTNKENKGIGKEVKHTLEEQNKKILQIGTNLDRAQTDADKLNAKFTDFILDSSFCKLYMLIIALGFVLLFLLWI